MFARLSTKSLTLFLVVVGSVFVLAVGWEFWLEPNLLSSHKESDFDRWESILIATLLSALGLVTPLWARARNDRRESRLREELSRAAAVFEHTQDAVLITDALGHIVTVNPAFTLMTGFSEQDVLGRDESVLSSGHHPPEFFRDLWAQLRSEGRWQGEVWNRNKAGEVSPFWQHITRVTDRAGRITHYVCVLSNVSSLLQKQRELSRLAYHDPLTGLANRLLFDDRLDHALGHARRRESRLAVLFIDLDDFKAVNDRFGHAVGDEVLRQTAQRLIRCVRDSDTVARLGGDELTVILEDLDEAGHSGGIAQTLVDEVSRPIPSSVGPVSISPSIGIAAFPSDAEDAEALLRAADQAMYRAKAEGGHRYCYFAPA